MAETKVTRVKNGRVHHRRHILRELYRRYKNPLFSGQTNSKVHCALLFVLYRSLHYLQNAIDSLL